MRRYARDAADRKKSLPMLVAGIFRTAMRESVKERDTRREMVERRAEVGVQHVAGRVFHVEADGAILELAHEVDGDARGVDALLDVAHGGAVEVVVRLG